jgi:homoserine dehydrogenase
VKTEIGVGMIGLGNVGSGVAEALLGRREYFARQVGAPLIIRRVAVRNPDKPRSVSLPPGVLTTDVRAVVTDPAIDVVVEIAGGEEPVGAYVLEAIRAGKHVVTANKELISKAGPELLHEAHSRGLDIMFEASVGGGIPLIAPLRRDLLANRIDRIRAIINGTTNYILTRMAQEGLDYEVALAAAQGLGYAEPDPTNDVEGIDAAYKLSIMASLGFRTRVRHTDVQTTGITRLTAIDFANARDMGYVIKLLAVAERLDGGIVARVAPVLVPHTEPLSRVDGVYNAVQIEGDLTGSVLFQGRGAGAGPTTSAVLADLLDLAHAIVLGARERKYWGPDVDVPVLGSEGHESRYYLRFAVQDRPGVLAQIARTLGDAGVSISAVRQQESSSGEETADLVIMTHSAREGVMADALAGIAQLDVVTNIGSFLRVEG